MMKQSPTASWSLLRILIFGLNYAPELTGIGKFTGEMASWLAGRGHAVHVVTSHPYYPAWRISDEYRGRGYVREGGGPAGDGVVEPLVLRCPLYVPEKVTGLKRVLHLFSFAFCAAPIVLREALLPRFGGEPPDLIWTVEPTFFGAPVALAAASLAQAPVWMHIQDFEVDAAFELGLLPANGWIHAAAVGIEAAFLRAFDRASSISLRMVERLLQKGVRPERAALFPNWVDVDGVQPAPAGAANRFRSELGLHGKVVLLYSGNMGSKQGLELLPSLAHAIAEDSAIHLLLCGDGAFRPTMESMVRELSNVTLLPLQPLESLNELLNCADIHLLPQRADAADLVMPSKLTGMLASGRPVIATAQAGTQVAAVVSGALLGEDRLSHEPCGVVVPAGDLASLLEAVRTLAADPLERTRMGAAARRYAVEHLSREKVLEQFEQDLVAAVKNYRHG
jgi:colanic acid biosynthesis glycosyl transferase WcaI